MKTARLSTKGQILLPKTLRNSHHWTAGMEFALEEVPSGVLLRPLRPFPPAKVADVYGCLPHRGRAKTVQEMDEAITKEVKARRTRGRY
jgi:bifunctional DNA-binding transcriptional regulator/antitoxin component of YhaV-PrlF toxin-antitoxin module